MTNISAADWSHAIDDSPKTIGRSRESEIRVPLRFRTVSRRHAEVWREELQIWIKDLGSLAGTQVNGVWLPAKRPTPAAIGDRLTLGELELQICADSAAEGPVHPSFLEADGNDRTFSADDLSNDMRQQLRSLTPCELDIVLWMRRGICENEELGRVLNRSPNTIRTQIGSILQKLRLRSRISILSWLQTESNAAMWLQERRRPRVFHAEDA